MEKEKEIQHQIVVVLSAGLAHTVLQSVGYIHDEHPWSKLVKAAVFDVLHFLPETDRFPPVHVLPAAAAVPIVFAPPTLADIELAVATPTVSDAPFADIISVLVTPTAS
jgi:hypothetical protein